VKVTGTGQDPHLDGTIDIRGGAFAVPDLGTAYTGLDTRVDLTADALTISEMRIVDEHQQVMTVGGTLAVHERSVGAVNIEIHSENFEVIDNPLADLKLDTDIRLTGELRAPRLQGSVEVETGTIDVTRVLEQFTADPYSTEAVEFNPQAVEPPTRPTRASILDALDLELGIGIPSNLVLRGTDMRPQNATIDMGDMNATVGGAIQVRKAAGQDVRIVGEVNTVRGNYTFQGRRFEILRDGRIRFAGTEDIDPQLDLRARRIISGVETFVRVQGSMRTPELSFSSNPPLDQADILSLIVFNMPLNELGEGQQISLAERAGALAGGYLASGLTRGLADALELDEFEIQAQGERGMGPTVSIGEQVGEKLFFRVRQGFGDAQATEFILEYQIADYLRLQGSVAETGGGTQRVTFHRIERGGLDLIFFFSY
jgi:translocation and assembly module TamB